MDFLQYVARYVRRPTIAQHRFTKITDQGVEFLTKDLKEKRANPIIHRVLKIDQQPRKARSRN